MIKTLKNFQFEHAKYFNRINRSPISKLRQKFRSKSFGGFIMRVSVSSRLQDHRKE